MGLEIFRLSSAIRYGTPSRCCCLPILPPFSRLHCRSLAVLFWAATNRGRGSSFISWEIHFRAWCFQLVVSPQWLPSSVGFEISIHLGRNFLLLAWRAHEFSRIANPAIRPVPCRLALPWLSIHPQCLKFRPVGLLALYGLAGLFRASEIGSVAICIDGRFQRQNILPWK